MGITLKDAQRHLKAWLNAELAVSSHQSYQIGSRMLTRANLKEIREEIKFWSGTVTRLEAAKSKGGGRNRVYRCVPRDL